MLKQEEERFAETLANGMVLLEGAIRSLRGAKVIDGDTVFKLYDTYGFPPDLTADIARERGLTVDQARLRAAMEEQRARSQQASKFGVDRAPGQRSTRARCSRATSASRARAGRGAAARGRSRSSRSSAARAARSILDRTPFYAESGGQVGDAGELQWRRGGARSRSTDTQKRCGRAFGHLASLPRAACRSAMSSLARGGCRSAARRTRAEPQRHAPAARGPAQGARRTRACRRARSWPRTGCASTSRTSSR